MNSRDIHPGAVGALVDLGLNGNRDGDRPLEGEHDKNHVELVGTVTEDPTCPQPGKGRTPWMRFKLHVMGRRDNVIPIVAFGGAVDEGRGVVRPGERISAKAEVSTEVVQGQRGPWVKVEIVARSIARAK